MAVKDVHCCEPHVSSSPSFLFEYKQHVYCVCKIYLMTFSSSLILDYSSGQHWIQTTDLPLGLAWNIVHPLGGGCVRRTKKKRTHSLQMWHGPILPEEMFVNFIYFFNGNLGCDAVERVVLLFVIYEDNFKWRICGFSNFMSILAQWRFCCMLTILFSHQLWPFSLARQIVSWQHLWFYKWLISLL